jgi:hypothetical protein
VKAPLKPNHELFSQRVATGLSATAAYRAIYGAAKNADVFGPRLMGNDGIRARIAELQAASATSATLTMQERREMLAAAARCKTVKHGDLVAIVLADARLAGELIEKREQKDTTTREPLAELRARVDAARAWHARS